MYVHMENLFELNDLHAFVKRQKIRQFWTHLHHVFINEAQTVKLLSFMAVKDKFGLCYGQTIEA